MIPLTPSPRKSRLRIGDFNGDMAKASQQAPSPLPPPPLYQHVGKEGKNVRKAPVVVVGGDKKVNRIPRSPNSWFVPVRYSEERYVGTPPISPYHPRGTCSPASSMTSWTTNTTEAHEAPDFVTVNSNHPNYSLSPSTHYYYPASPASYASTPNNNNNGRYGSRASTPTNYCKSPGYGSTSPLKSPKKKRSSVSSVSSDDINRKQRIKTELCLHYKNGNPCPFGVNCTYAHGEEELQKTRLMDLQRAGLIEDAETYRTKPCWTWVATGSCPFGKRCIGIHDPRITGVKSSWLPHTETQGNSISTDINVDGLHQKRSHAILYGNPFGDQFSLELDDWADLYKLVCNTSTTNKRRRNTLSEVHKLSIALQMRGESGWMYKYRPQHLIYDTLCMVLSTRVFRLEKTGKAVPIPLSNYMQNNSTHVLVRELAFGPDSEATVRGVALYFNILEEHVTECTPQQAKRFRFKKNPSQESKPKTSEFDGRECFTMIRPHDKDAFEFATDILTHRLETVQAERLSVLHERFEVIKTLQKQKEELRETFLAHKRSWINWCWPISAGRQTIDDDTRVPPVDAEYVPIIDSEAMVEQTETEAIKGSAIQPIWESFVSQSTAFSKIATATGQDNSSIWDADVQPSSSRDRLPILARLGHGEPISLDRSLPQITKGTKHSKTSSLDRQSERCWRALLLRQDNKHHGNEWNIVEEHFQKSRSKKTLRIIQN